MTPEEINSLKAENQINRDAAENGRRRIIELNDRIVQFEEHRAGHLELVKHLKAKLEEKDAEIKSWKDIYASCPACGESFVSLASTTVECHDVKIENTRLKAKLEKAEAALDYIANHISVSPDDEDGGPDRFHLSMDRNERILKAREALREIRK